MAVLSINNTKIFEIYKTWLIIMDNCIIKYNANYKKFLFRILLKSEIMNSIIKSIKKDTINWKMAVATSQ